MGPRQISGRLIQKTAEREGGSCVGKKWGQSAVRPVTKAENTPAEALSRITKGAGDAGAGGKRAAEPEAGLVYPRMAGWRGCKDAHLPS
jgi:hypothetical protein